jgi:microcystin-dependent protein
VANLQDIVKRQEVGTIKPWGKATAPAGYVLCDGTAISRTDYADLFGVISTTYGAGNGSTTFNVPNLQGKMAQGYDGSTYNLAGTGGANTVTVAVTNNQAGSSTVTNNQSVTVTGSIDNTSLTSAQLASHRHEMNENNGPITGGNYRKVNGQQVNDGGPTWSPNPMNEAGSGTGHNHSHTLAGTLTGTVAVATNLTGTVTAAGTNSFSPYLVLNYIIKH